jgi:alkanesulfonate monooxygenase SsuD/methylene tetrahydromethanopterin reductase-like flavin-dependent oxidoreductase (luciferase family)
MAATLQNLTGGRLILGMGAGWLESEHQAYGYPFLNPATRIKQLEEAIQIVKKMWTEETVSFRGKYYKIEEAHCNPKPKPSPPILICSGSGKKMMNLVARYADRWNLGKWSTVEEYDHYSSILREYCSEVGRDYEKIKKMYGGMVAIAETQSEANRIASSNPFVSGMNKERYLVGTPHQIRESLKKYVDIGVKYFNLRFLDFPDTKGVKLFIKTVIS